MIANTLMLRSIEIRIKNRKMRKVKSEMVKTKEERKAKREI